MTTKSGASIHMEKCSEDNLYQLAEYSWKTNLRVENTEDEKIRYFLVNPDNTEEKIEVSERVTEILSSSAMLWDMMGANFEYETWKQKIALANKHPLPKI